MYKYVVQYLGEYVQTRYWEQYKPFQPYQNAMVEIHDTIPEKYKIIFEEMLESQTWVRHHGDIVFQVCNAN